jgi:hypothetical protein
VIKRTVVSKTPRRAVKHRDALSLADDGMIALNALIKSVPVIGAGLDELIFGAAREIRFKRLEDTLAEIAAAVGGDAPGLRAEEFAQIVTASLPRIAKATSERSRTMLRDLLVKAAGLEAGDQRWEEASLASDTLANIQPPGLAIIAGIANPPADQVRSLVSLPVPQVIAMRTGEFNWGIPTVRGEPLGFDWPTTEEWFYRLHDMRIVSHQSSDARGGWDDMRLKSLGRLLVDWCLSAAKV